MASAWKNLNRVRMFVGMSDLDAAPIPSSSQPHPPSGPERIPAHPAFDFIKKVFAPEKIPGWTGLLLSVLFGIANWKGVIDLYLPAIQAVSGVAVATILDTLASPVVSVVLAFWSGLYLWLVSSYVHPSDRRFLAAFAWVLFAVFVVPFASLSLFGYFITQSGIPAAVRYYAIQKLERRLDEDQSQKLYIALRKVADRLPVFNVTSARNPESMQYANDFMGVFFGSGLHLANGPRQSAGIDPLDLMSPAFRGLMIGVKDFRAPPPPALILRDALKEGGVSAYFVNLPTVTEDQFSLIIGLK